jgi:hypothetical protein
LHFSAGLGIGFIVHADPGASAGFHQHAVAMGLQLAHRSRGEANTIFVILDFLRQSDEHDFGPMKVQRDRGSAAETFRIINSDGGLCQPPPALPSKIYRRRPAMQSLNACRIPGRPVLFRLYRYSARR